MDLKYPIFLILGIILIVIILLPINIIKLKQRVGKTKVANTKKLKNTSIYKSTTLKYNIIINALRVLSIAGIVLSLVLLARPFSVVQEEQNEYNRDIFLCMDMSASVWDLNGEVVENLKQTVNSLKGDRFGISIFNTTSVVLTPLTDDYQSVLEELDRLKEALRVGKEYFGAEQRGEFKTYYYSHYADWDYIDRQIDYLLSGTLIYYEKRDENGNRIQDTTRGSSLIGDGLASCVFSFSGIDTDEERSRVIIFTTDNDLAGEPYISLSDAASLSSRKGIHLFGIGTKNVVNEREMKTAIESNGKGRYYQQSQSSVNSIIDNIELTSKNLNKHATTTHEIELPRIPFIFLCLSCVCLILLGKVVEE